jgi:HlyD family secretion protein
MKLKSFLSAAALPASEQHEWHATDPWVDFGNRTVYLLFGGLLLASMMFDISGAVVASGSVSVDGNYKAVQHLEGGIVSKILVHNGDRVKSGQVLVHVDDTQAKASMSSTAAKVTELAIQEARLIAERDRKESFSIPEGIDASAPEIAKTLQAQQDLFKTRRTAYLGQQKVLAQRLAQSESDLKGAASQLDSKAKERDLNQRELATVKPLFDKGYVSLQRISPLQREEVRINGDIANLKAEFAKLKSARAEVEARLAQADKEYSQQAAEDLQKVQTQLAEQRETLKATSDRFQRTEVRAPVSGTVHALAVHTEGGVIQPGSTLLQIVPDGQELVVSAKITPNNIDSVHIGQVATVRFSAFDSHTTPHLKGHVRKVSAAEITDNEGKTFFTTEIEVPPAELQKLERGQRLIPGMPADVFMETRSRSILSYFLKPLTDMMARAFREG